LGTIPTIRFVWCNEVNVNFCELKELRHLWMELYNKMLQHEILLVLLDMEIKKVS